MTFSLPLGVSLFLPGELFSDSAASSCDVKGEVHKNFKWKSSGPAYFVDGGSLRVKMEARSRMRMTNTKIMQSIV